MRLPLLLLVVVAGTGCNFGGASTPTFGRWTVTEITGQISYVDSGAACVGNWTFSTPDLAHRQPDSARVTASSRR